MARIMLHSCLHSKCQMFDIQERCPTNWLLHDLLGVYLLGLYISHSKKKCRVMLWSNPILEVGKSSYDVCICNLFSWWWYDRDFLLVCVHICFQVTVYIRTQNQFKMRLSWKSDFIPHTYHKPATLWEPWGGKWGIKIHSFIAGLCLRLSPLL